MPERKSQCSIDRCGRPHYAKGLCKFHYARKARGDPDWDSLEKRAPGPRRAQGACLVAGCGESKFATGLCRLHYQRRHRGLANWDSLAPLYELRKPPLCPNGHPQSAVNTEPAPDGTRRCRKCRAEEDRRAREERNPACTIEGCERQRRTPGSDLCGMHYQRKRLGYPNWDEPGVFTVRMPRAGD